MTHSKLGRSGGATAGFSLVEALVALAVLALLLVVLSGGFQLVLRQTDLEAGASALRSTATMRDALIRHLTTAAPIAFRRRDGTAARGLAGEADHVEFATPAPLASVGLMVMAVRTRVDSAGRTQLVMTSRAVEPIGARASEGAPEDVTILSQDVHSLKFRYFGAGANRLAPARWRSKWDAVQLPDLIELSIEYARGKGGARGDVIVVAPARSRTRDR